MSSKEWPLWEVFIRSKQGLSHKHVGSLRASDATMAIENARDVYTRRSEGISIWVVESKMVSASDPLDSDAFFEPSEDKIYRHPTFYDVPDGISHM
jgi:ring-1,2-phenylacetyl-CoA epoxidase subunit PaaB